MSRLWVCINIERYEFGLIITIAGVYHNGRGIPNAFCISAVDAWPVAASRCTESSCARRNACGVWVRVRVGARPKAKAKAKAKARSIGSGLGLGLRFEWPSAPSTAPSCSGRLESSRPGLALSRP